MNILKLEEILKIINLWEQNDPIKQFIRDQGFDPDAGDFLLLPIDFELKVEHPNVKYDQFINCAILLKKPELTDLVSLFS